MSMEKQYLMRHTEASICDSHMHIFQMAGQKPDAQTTITLPVPVSTIDEYMPVANRLGIRRFVVVQPSHFGTDNRTTLAAVHTLGTQARAAVIPPHDAGETDLAELTAAGGVAARAFLLRETGFGIPHLKQMAKFIEPFGWHLEVQCHGEALSEVLPILRTLPVPTVIDHIGRLPPGTRVNSFLFRELMNYLETGKGWIKLSAPYHNAGMENDSFHYLQPQIQALATVAPNRLVWGTNWPHVSLKTRPDDLLLATRLLDLLSDVSLVRRILVDNPATLYRFSPN